MLHVAIKPSTGKRLIGRLHHLHVLLRHRPRSYPAGSGVGVAGLLRSAKVHGFEGLRPSGGGCATMRCSTATGPGADPRGLVRAASACRLHARALRKGRDRRSSSTHDPGVPRPGGVGPGRGPRITAGRQPAQRPCEAWHRLDLAPAVGARRRSSQSARPSASMSPQCGIEISPVEGQVDGPMRTISTFSCDIARAVSRRLRSRRERLAPTGPRLRGRLAGL